MNTPLTTDLVAELAALSQTTVFHSDTFKRSRAAMKAAGLEIERLRAAMTQACSDMGCYCADDDPLPENLKCPMCKLEKALHG